MTPLASTSALIAPSLHHGLEGAMRERAEQALRCEVFCLASIAQPLVTVSGDGGYAVAELQRRLTVTAYLRTYEYIRS